jgi:hypothetical protein
MAGTPEPLSSTTVGRPRPLQSKFSFTDPACTNPSLLRKLAVIVPISNNLIYRAETRKQNR